MCWWHIPKSRLSTDPSDHGRSDRTQRDFGRRDHGRDRGAGDHRHPAVSCCDGGEPGILRPRHPDVPDVISVEDAMARAQDLMDVPDFGRTPSTGFVGFGGIGEGDTVLLVANDMYDDVVVDGIKRALEQAGAVVSVYRFNDPYAMGVTEDRELTETDEIDVIIRRDGKSFENYPRRYDFGPYAHMLDHYESVGYDAVMQGYGGPVPEDTPYRYEAFPWVDAEDFVSPATAFPHELNKLINEKTWERIYGKGRGGTVRLTDPEGTDIEYTLSEKYWEQDRIIWNETPLWGHIMAHPIPPLVDEGNASGVIAGTTSHFNRPFPRIELHLEDGVVVDIEGGGEYGDAWRSLLEETKDVSYPGFPNDGLFHFMECAIGTNPLVHRPKNTLLYSGGGTERERNRSGVIHCGLGTSWRQEGERWAAENDQPYGHLHVHLLFPTLEIDVGRDTIRVIEDGHLMALDDPEVRELAAKFGDPDELLTERWVPEVPGVNTPGNYEDYARDPAPVIQEQLESR